VHETSSFDGTDDEIAGTTRHSPGLFGQRHQAALPPLMMHCHGQFWPALSGPVRSSKQTS
jgi:hypothetical protein